MGKRNGVMIKRIRIGTRASDLALAQTDLVIAALYNRFSDIEAEKIILRTRGDRILDRPLVEFGGKGVFVSEFERALAEGEIDLAVHSAKDMPMETGHGMVIPGVLPRADARDVLVANRGTFVRLQQGGIAGRTGKVVDGRGSGGTFVIGTGSIRRQLQVSALYPGAVCRGIRGNVTTRLQKLRDREYDGLVLAAAGLERLGLLQEEDLEYHFFSYGEMIPAGGQGIIAIEGREGDRITDMVRDISDNRAYRELSAERKILEMLGAGCHEAVGVFAQHSGESVRIRLFRGIQGEIIKLDETAQGRDYMELAGKLAEAAHVEQRGDLSRD